MKDYAQILAEKREELASCKAKRLEIISTGQSWSLKNGEDGRGITNVSLAALNSMIRDLERDIAQLEDMVERTGGCPRGIRVGAGIL